jgi:hypothetical protein
VSNRTGRFLRESVLDAEDEAALRRPGAARSARCGLGRHRQPDRVRPPRRHRRSGHLGPRPAEVRRPDRARGVPAPHGRPARRDGGGVQPDRPPHPADAQRCRADLARLVEADGLPGVPVISTRPSPARGSRRFWSCSRRPSPAGPAAMARPRGRARRHRRHVRPAGRRCRRWTRRW